MVLIKAGEHKFEVKRIRRGVYKFTPIRMGLKPIRVYGSMQDIKLFARTRAQMGEEFYYPKWYQKGLVKFRGGHIYE